MRLRRPVLAELISETKSSPASLKELISKAFMPFNKVSPSIKTSATHETSGMRSRTYLQSGPSTDQLRQKQRPKSSQLQHSPYERHEVSTA